MAEISDDKLIVLLQYTGVKIEITLNYEFTEMYKKIYGEIDNLRLLDEINSTLQARNVPHTINVKKVLTVHKDCEPLSKSPWCPVELMEKDSCFEMPK